MKLKKLMKVIAPKQDFSAWYADDNYRCSYFCIYCSYANKHFDEFMKRYGKCPVSHIKIDQGNEIHIYLKRGSMKYGQ